MQSYNATVEVERRDFQTMSDADTGRIFEALPGMSAALAESPRGWLSATITAPAESLTQAAVVAVAVVEKAFGAAAVSVEVMSTREYDVREGFEPTPDLVSVSEAAGLLGVSRQAVLQRIAAHTLPATKVGREYVIPRNALP